MKRDQSEDGKPSSATPGEPPPAEAPEAPPVFPPAEPDVIPSAESKEVPVPPLSEELREGLEPSADKGRRPPPFEGSTLVRLGKGIEIPIERLDQYALALAAQYPDKDWVEEIIPLACQRIGQMSGFFSGVDPAELEFATTHGRRWRAGEGIFLSSAEGLAQMPAVPELKFDPAKLEESCERLRSQFEGISFPAKPETLMQYVRECHKAIHRERERRKTVLRAKGRPNTARVSRQSYRAFVRRGFVFAGNQVLFLKAYIDYRSKGSTAQKAEQLVLAKRRRKPWEKKSLAEERKSST